MFHESFFSLSFSCSGEEEGYCESPLLWCSLLPCLEKVEVVSSFDAKAPVSAEFTLSDWWLVKRVEVPFSMLAKGAFGGQSVLLEHWRNGSFEGIVLFLESQGQVSESNVPSLLTFVLLGQSEYFWKGGFFWRRTGMLSKGLEFGHHPNNNGNGYVQSLRG